MRKWLSLVNMSAVRKADAVVDTPGQTAFADGGDRVAVERRGLHGDPQGAGDHTANVEEGQASLVLLVHLLGGRGDAGGEEHDRRRAEFGGPYGRGCVGDADLRGREPHALAAEVVGRRDAVHGVSQLLDDALGGVFVCGQLEGARGLGEDAGAVLDDSEASHALAGLHLDHRNSPWFASDSGLARNLHSRR